MDGVGGDARLIDPLVDADPGVLAGLEQVLAQVGHKARAGLRLEGVTVEIAAQIGIPAARPTTDSMVRRKVAPLS